MRVIALIAERFAGLCLFVMMALTFCSAIFRYVFVAPIPDSDSLAGLLLGVVVAWGLASTFYNGESITIDLLWQALGKRGRWLMDGFAGVVTIAAMLGLASVCIGYVHYVFLSNEITYDLRVPVWPFYAVTAAGMTVTTGLILLRFVKDHASAGH